MAISEMLRVTGRRRSTRNDRRDGLNQRLQSLLTIGEAASREIDDVLRLLGSSPDGLSRVQALKQRLHFGFNEIAHERPPAWYVQLAQTVNNPFVLLLLLLAAVSWITGDMTATLLIGAMVAISMLLRFFQEFRSAKAAEKLQEMVEITATVSRADRRTEIPQELPKAFGVVFHPGPATLHETPVRMLVPGDVVQLSAGDLVPADVRLISSKDLFVSQSALTGESFPLEKTALNRTPIDAGQLNTPLDLPNACFMGTNVISGTAHAVVVATGAQTHLGSLAGQVVGRRALTSFDIGVNQVSWMLIRFMLVMVPLIFVINGWTKGDWKSAFFFGLSVAVGLTPEMLPMIVTANLARGGINMSRQKVIVKRLNSIQNFGAMDVLCTDKTGTLTQDKVTLLQHLDVNGHDDPEVLEYAFLNSYFQTGLKNLLDRAVLEHEDLLRTRSVGDRYLKCDEVPFDFQRRRMSVVVHEVFRGRDLLICKGAVEEVLAVCSRVRIADRIVPLADVIREHALGLCQRLNHEGQRVIAVAYKQVDSSGSPLYGIADESDLVLCGFIAFYDPPKETAAPAVSALRQHGVSVKILTGDNELVARKVCHDVGLDVSRTIVGSMIEDMSDGELETAADDATLFAKLTPSQKARIIRALKNRGHTVGFLGDGINDAPALRESDVGISVDNGADIARESSDIILLEKSLLVLEQGVLIGRRTHGNIIKYIKMAASSNFGNMFSVLVASVWLPFLPMLPVMLLVQNLLYDISQIMIPYDRVDGEYLEEPRRWCVDDVRRFIFCIGPISSIFDILTYGVLWFVLGANTPATQALFQSGWFVEGLLSQTLIIHLIRTSKVPFLQSVAALPLAASTLAIMGLALVIPNSSLGAAIGMVPLPGDFYPWLGAILLAYCALTQLVKVWYIRRFGMWL